MKRPRKLPEDRKDSARIARRNGWHIDRDLWWVRDRRKGDPEIDSATVGFTTRRRIYVRSAGKANRYDRRDRRPTNGEIAEMLKAEIAAIEKMLEDAPP